MKKLSRLIAIVILTCATLVSAISADIEPDPKPQMVQAVKIVEEPVDIPVKQVSVEPRMISADVIEMEPKPEPEPEPEHIEEESPLSDEEIELIALVVMAEAEGESEEGKRLVIDTILNRVDSELSYFPNTVEEVVYQPSQFSSMWNGRVDRCEVTEEHCELVKEELRSRSNSDVVYFHAGKYGKYGTPAFQVGNHYFSV